MSIKASEITDLIQARIKNFEAATEARNVGTVVSVTDGICRVHGLADAAYGEMLEFPDNTFGLALNLEQDSVGAVVLGEYRHIGEGATVKTTGRILEVPVGRRGRRGDRGARDRGAAGKETRASAHEAPRPRGSHAYADRRDAHRRRHRAGRDLVIDGSLKGRIERLGSALEELVKESGHVHQGI